MAIDNPSDFEKGVTATEQQVSSISDIQNKIQAANQRSAELNSPYIVKDTSTGVELPVDSEEDLSLALISGQYVPQSTELFNVITPEGRRGTVDSANIQKVLKNGQARLESKAETQLAEDEIKFGSKTGQAAALGAARGLTFGASDVLAKESGLYSGEELRGIESANLGTSIAGEVAGAVVPAFFSGGTSTVASGAKLATTGLRVSEALGAKAAKLVSKSLLKQGVSETAAKGIAKRLLYGAAPEVANLAVQGGLQGAGRLVTESTFGTAEMNAENLIAYAGTGAIFGGTFGTVIGTGKALIPSAKTLLARGESKVADDLFNREKSALDIADLTPSAIVKAEAKRPEFKKLLANEVEDIINVEKPRNIEDFHNAVASKHESIGSDINSIYKKADEIKSAATNSESTAVLNEMGVRNANSVSANVMKSVDDHLEVLGMATSEEQMSALRKYGTSYAERLTKELDKGPITATKLQEIAKNLQDTIYPKKAGGAPVMATVAEDSLKGLQKSILESVRREQREIVREAASLGGESTLLDMLLAKNKSYSVLSEIKFNSLKRAESEAKKSGIVNELSEFSLNPFKILKKGLESFTVQKAAVMQSMEKSLRSNETAISSMLNGLLKTSKAVASGTSKSAAAISKASVAPAIRNLTSFELSTKMVDGKKVSAKNDDEAYRNILDNASVSMADPESVLKQSNRSTSSLFEHAPNTAAVIDAKYLQMMQFIASKNKGSNKKTGAFDISKLAPVSGFEKAKMGRYLEAIESPTEVLKKASKGSLSREHIEVIKTLYPELHKKIKINTLEFIAKKSPVLSYQQKLQMGLLLDLNSHESMDPANIRGLQASFEPESGTEQGSSTSYSKSSMDSFSKSESMESPVQSHDIGE